MTSARKDSAPPARPPAPKLSLSKMKGRQHSTGSIAIRFNASSLDDDYDLEDEIAMGSTPSDVVRFEMGGGSDLSVNGQAAKPVELRPAGEVSSRRNTVRCKSAPVSEVTTPVSSLDDHSFVKPQQQDVIGLKEDGERSSIFSGIRERLQDPLTSLLEKVEELSGESGIAEAIDRKLKAGGVRNVAGSVTVNSLPEPSVDTNGSASPEASDADSSMNGATSAVRDELWERTGSFEIVDDFYSEPLDATDSMAPSMGTPIEIRGQTLVKSNSSDQILRSSKSPMDATQKPAKARLRVKKSKSKGEDDKAVSVSLSGILSDVVNDMEDALIEEEKFYDLDDVRESKDSSSTSTRPVQRQVSGGTLDTPSLMPSMHRIIAATVCLLAYIVIPMPSFMSGAVFGATLAAVAICVYQWMNVPPTLQEPFILPDLEGLPALEVPEMRESKNEDGRFKGWMNELGNYDQDNYHINQTQSVYVQLEGTRLRMQTPKQNVPKRSMWNEPQTHPSCFVAQRHLEIIGSKVFLLPAGLVKKRLWSKKYPICVQLGPLAHQAINQKCQPIDAQPPGDDSQSAASAQGQEVVEKPDSTVLYLFARTGREKEEWFRRLDAAAKGTPLPTKMAELVHKLEGWPVRTPSTNSISPTVPDSGGMKHKRQGSADSSCSEEAASEEQKPEDVLTKYMKYMARIMPSESPLRVRPCGRIQCEPVVLWANALVARGLWDFIREDYWAEKVKDKIQKKLSKIHVPYFIDELTVTDIVLGNEIPVFRRVSKPYLDDRGLWMDMEVAYSGGFHMSLETKVNLMKLKRTKSSRDHNKTSNKRSPVTHEEEEDSAESSTDDEAVEDFVEATEDRPVNQQSGGNTSKKILRIVDKITQSKYFQQATEYKYIKKAMEGVSNTRLMLSVELRSMVGTLAVNIPPPPTDRLWYGFRTNPKLWLCAKPKVGSREVSVSHITDWIEKKLIVEFQRTLVLPNMEDISIHPVLWSNFARSAPSSS